MVATSIVVTKITGFDNVQVHGASIDLFPGCT